MTILDSSILKKITFDCELRSSHRNSRRKERKMSMRKGFNGAIKSFVVRLSRIPYFAIELSLIVSILSFLLLSNDTLYTANQRQTMDAMKTETIEEVQENTTPIEGEFEQTESFITIKYDPSQMCFIGDQRLKDMKNLVTSKANFITNETANVTWLKETAIPEMTAAVEKQDLYIVMLGLNDLDMAEEYAQVLNEFSTTIPSASFVFVTVGPVNEEYLSKNNKITNTQIDDFNSAMMSGLNNQWQVVDLCQYINDNKEITNGEDQTFKDDGLLYTENMNTQAFDWILNTVQNQKLVIN